MNRKIIVGLALLVLFIILNAFLFIVFTGSLLITSSSKTYSVSDRNYGIDTDVTSSLGVPGSSYQLPAQAEYHAEPTAATEGSKFSAMYFMDYGTTFFMDTALNQYSTFSVDVDTASYTVAKNYIMRGELPPTEAIRPEEFINYFEYNYQNPENDFSIISEIAPSPFDENIHYLRIGIKAKEGERKPAILTFIVDVSGSMSTENRLGLVKKSLNLLLDNLDEGDQVAIIKYNTQASLVLNHTDDKDRLIAAIDSLTAGGSTNAEAGLLLGYQEASKVFDKTRINRVILLSDGVANVGNTGPEQILKEIASYKQKGIDITTVGVGMGNYNDVLLEKLADQGDGNYAYINDFEEAKRIFGKELLTTLQTLAWDAKIQVEFNPESVSEFRIIGYENRLISETEFRNDTKDAGEVGSGEEITAVYELKLKNQNEIGKIYLRYMNEANEIMEISEDISDARTSFQTSSRSFKKAIAVARFAQILKLTQPPPSIAKVAEIITTTGIDTDNLNVFINAQRLIEIRQGE